jgi:hypothetical protein
VLQSPFSYPGVAQQTEEPQQIADPDFKPAVEKPVYTTVGPVVVLDEAHGDFHTVSGRYKPFADVLQADGYRVGCRSPAFHGRPPGDTGENRRSPVRDEPCDASRHRFLGSCYGRLEWCFSRDIHEQGGTSKSAVQSIPGSLSILLVVPISPQKDVP